MQLHNFTSLKKKRGRRVGRGGKRGTTAGRGTKGQKSRAGRKIRPHERDLIIRIPKKRGFNNRSIAVKAKVINLQDIERALSKGGAVSEVSLHTLRGAGILPRDYKGKVKVLGKGKATTAITLKGFTVSPSAKEKIEKAGGKVVL